MWPSTNQNSNQLDHVIFNQSELKSAGSCDLQPIILLSPCHVTMFKQMFYYNGGVYVCEELVWNVAETINS